MNDFLHFVWMLAVIAFPFVAMTLMWRRMKRVRNQAYRDAETDPHQQAWQESLESADGLDLVRMHNPNDDLIALGAKAKQSQWPLSNP